MNLTDMIGLARPYIHNCPDLLVENELARSLRKFCEDTRGWRITEYIGLGKGHPGAEFCLDDDRTLVSIVDIFNDADECETPLGKVTGTSRLPTNTSAPKFYSSDVLGKLVFGPVPDKTYTMRVVLSIKPKLGIRTIDDVLYEQWGEIIADGAVYNLMLMPRTVWYNPNQANFHKARFDDGITEARTKISKGLVDANARAVRNHRWL